MNIYKVGGCVRDYLLGQEPKDIDYVVTNSSEKEMINLGYSQVGKDFPVFLNPENGFEYALARKERKTGNGYNGFSVDTENVSLEDDLYRRDLTINAMALDENNNIIDPFNGQKDLKNKILKHVSTHFAEDPLRILRVARFSARYDFSIHSDTINLMKKMVNNGEINHLVPERVWKEFEKVLNERYIINFFNNLEQINALDKIIYIHQLNDKNYFDFINKKSTNTFISNLIHVFSQLDTKHLDKLKIPTDYINHINHFSKFKSFYDYSSMSNNDKLNFINQHKATHNINNALITLENIIMFNNWKNDYSINFEVEKDNLMTDINKIKSIDYSDIINKSKELNIKPNELVNELQLNILSNTNKLKAFK